MTATFRALQALGVAFYLAGGLIIIFDREWYGSFVLALGGLLTAGTGIARSRGYGYAQK